MQIVLCVARSVIAGSEGDAAIQWRQEQPWRPWIATPQARPAMTVL